MTEATSATHDPPPLSASGSPQGAQRALWLAVLASGAGGLTWEVLWQHHTALALGVSAYGTAITLACIMAGFALGGLGAAALAARGRLSGPAAPLRAYGYAELALAATALLVPPGLALLARLDQAVFRGAPGLAPLVQLCGTALLLLLPAAAMGATLPFLSAHAERSGARLSTLYALNTLGAVLGVLLVTFAALPLLGVQGTGFLAAVIDLLVARYALTAAGDASGGAQADAGQERRPDAAALALAGLSGLSIFILEVSWFRSLRSAYQASTETFAVLLAAFLLPLAGGAALAPRLQRRVGLAPVLAAAILLVLWATPLVDRVDRLIPGGVLTPARYLLVPLLIAAPVLALGVIFPTLLSRYPGARATGHLYAANTLGAVLGSLLAGFALLPTIGATRASWLAGLLLLLGVPLCAPRRLGALGLAGGAAALGLCGALLGDSGAGRLRVQGVNTREWTQVLYVAEGPDATVAVVGDQRGDRNLVIDGFVASGEVREAHYMAWMGHLPALATPRLDRALVICFGTGQTADAVRQHRPGRLDIVDVSPAVLRGAPLFPKNHGVLQDPAVQQTVMDGRAFLRRDAGAPLDLVTLEPMAPNFAGTNNLYSREFYELVRARLSPTGVAAQWVPFHLITPDHLVGIVAAFIEVFPESRLWVDPVDGTGILLGGTRAPMLHPSARKLELDDAQIAKGFVLEARGLRMLAAMGGPVTDDNQLLAYGLQRLAKFRYGGALGAASAALVQRFAVFNGQPAPGGAQGAGSRP